LGEYNQQLRAVAATTSTQGQHLQQATVRMVEVNEATGKKLEEFSEVVGAALTHTQVLAEGYQKLRATMAAEHTETVQAAKYIHGPTIQTLNGLIAKLEPVGAKLNEAASINHLASDRFGELVEDMRDIRNTLDRAVNRTEAVVTPELVTGLGGIVLRLSHLQELLEGLVKALPVGAWVAPASVGDWPPLFDDNLAGRAQ
jgi:hypothetical protein